MRLFNYVLRLSYDAPELACSRLDALINDYDSKFDLAYPVSHRRFKHHGLKHLAKYLRLWGPFRHYWCMGFEGFLQARRAMPCYTLRATHCALHTALALLHTALALLHTLLHTARTLLHVCNNPAHRLSSICSRDATTRWRRTQSPTDGRCDVLSAERSRSRRSATIHTVARPIILQVRTWRVVV